MLGLGIESKSELCLSDSCEVSGIIPNIDDSLFKNKTEGKV